MSGDCRSIIDMYGEEEAGVMRTEESDDIIGLERYRLGQREKVREFRLKQEALEREAEEVKKEKRKLKKDRQREKKNEAKGKSEVKKEEDVNKSEEASGARKDGDGIADDTDSEFQDESPETDCRNISDSEVSDPPDIDFTTLVPAFIQSIVNQKDIVKKQQKKHDCGKQANNKDSPKNRTHKIDPTITNDTNGFTSVKKGTKYTPITASCKGSEDFGNKALQLIRENKFDLAIQCLNRGIALDRNDSRHYINRSYCYLRIGEYQEALADIRFASNHFTDIYEISRAKCREGQALSGLQDYDAAEHAFRESINLAPEFLFAKRELKRTQIMRILDMGFKERSAIVALEQKETTMDAITLLSEESLTSASYDRCESPNEDDEDDDDIFYSDTEEDPSNVTLLSKLLKYNLNMPEEPEIVPPYKEPLYNHCQVPRTPSQDPPLRIIKAVPPAKPKKTNQGINDMAIWIGSLTPLIKDEILIKRFSRFGKVVSVWRPPPTETYAFMNFQSATAAQKALEEAAFGGGTIEVNGCKLPIKPATNKNKTFK